MQYYAAFMFQADLRNAALRGKKVAACDRFWAKCVRFCDRFFAEFRKRRGWCGGSGMVLLKRWLCSVMGGPLYWVCLCDEMTNGVSVISHGPILLGGGEGGHRKRWGMLAGQSRP